MVLEDLNKNWKLMDVLKEATLFLESKNIENARRNAELILCKVLELGRVDLYLKFEQPLNQKERQIFKSYLRRRAAHEPLQYILGETEFMSLVFRTNPSVLIPRPETEILVEKAVEEIQKMFGR